MTGKLNNLFVLIFCFIGFTGLSQEEYNRAIQKYPNEPFIYLTKQENLTIKVKDCELDITGDHYIEKLSLRNSNQNLSDEFIGYSSFSEISDIEAYFLEPKVDKYQKTKIKNIVTSSVSDNSIFYDDYSHKRIVFPNLYQGCKSILSYTEKIKDPHIVGLYMFTGFFPVEFSQYTVTYPKEVNLSYKVFNNDDNRVQVNIENKRSNTKLIFTVRDYKPGYSLNNKFNSRYYLPHVVIYINDFTTCGKTTQIFKNTADLHHWYYQLTQDINHITPEIQSLSDSIISGSENKQDKLKSIFYWVQDNIKYIAFEDGYEGFVPRNAEKVKTRKYGDCKDMANLTTQLLKAAGINAYLTWIGTRSIPYTYEELPTPLVDNHMICTAEVDGKYYFLDATSYLAYNYPSDFILSKEALISKDQNEFEIVSIPEISCEKNIIYDSIYLSIQGNTLLGEGAVVLSGYYGFDMSTKTLFSNKENEKKIILTHVAKGSDKFQLKSYEIVNFKNRDQNNIINYAFSIPDYVKSFDDKLYVNLNLSTPYSKREVDKNEKLYGLLIENHGKIIVKNELQIPQNYSVSYLPDSINFNNKLFEFNISYSIKNNKVIYTFKLIFKTLKIDPSNFDNWNQLIKKLNLAYKKSIELTKIK